MTSQYRYFLYRPDDKNTILIVRNFISYWISEIEGIPPRSQTYVDEQQSNAHLRALIQGTTELTEDQFVLECLKLGITCELPV